MSERNISADQPSPSSTTPMNDNADADVAPNGDGAAASASPAKKDLSAESEKTLSRAEIANIGCGLASRLAPDLISI